MKQFLCLALALIPLTAKPQDASITYAEKLGFPKGKKVLIIHVDDAGMSLESNEGAAKALVDGVATSVSVMMPCPWVPGFVEFLNKEKNIDAGLHLTLNAEWKSYRWGPLAGRAEVPGLVDSAGAMWDNVPDVVKHASPEEVEKEIAAQLERARKMGFEPTHLDSHMGALFASEQFLEKYIVLGIREKIPVMMPAGHDTEIQREEMLPPEKIRQIQSLGKRIWDAGLPVLDDLQAKGFSWEGGRKPGDEELRDFMTAKYTESLGKLAPGLTMVILHCSNASEHFDHISGSGLNRRGDMLALTDPAFKKYIEDEGIILTTWREVMQRRQKVK